MSFKSIALAGAAAIALAACGGGEDSAAPETRSSAKAANLSNASPLDASFRLSDAQAVDIDKFLELTPGDAPPTYESATFDERLGAMVVSNLRFADAEDGEAIIVERAEFFGIDEAAIDRIQTAEATGADAPFETVFEKVRLLNIRTTGFESEEGEAADITIGGVEFDRLAIRQGGLEGNPDGEEAANFLNAVSLSGLYFKDIDVSAEADGAPQTSVSAPDVRLVGLAGGEIDAILAKDVSYDIVQGPEVRAAMAEAFGPQGGAFLNGPLGQMITPDTQRATIAEFEWRDIDFSGLVEYGLTGEEPPVSARDLIDLGSMRMTDMVSYVNGEVLATVKETTLSAGEFAWLIPSNIRLDTKGGEYDFTAYVPNKDDPAHAVLTERGLDKVTGDGFVEWTWNPDNGAGALDYEATTKGLADFTISFAMEGASLDDLAEANANGEEDAFIRNAKLKSFSMKVEDEAALDAVFALAALQMGGTGEDLRQSAPALIRISGSQVASLNPRILDYVDALASFVAEGGALEIAARPEEPLGAAALEDGSVNPQEIPDVLNLTVTHTE